VFYELIIGRDAVRRQVEQLMTDAGPKPQDAKPVRRRRNAARSASASALRGLAARLEPSPTH